MRFERQVLKDAIRNALDVDLNEVSGEPENVGAESLGQSRFEQSLELRLERRMNRRIERLEQRMEKRMEKRLERRLQRRMARRSWLRDLVSSFFGGASVAQTEMDTYADEIDHEDFDKLATEILDIVNERRAGRQQPALNEDALLDRLESRMERRQSRRGERRAERQTNRRTDRREKRREEIAEALNSTREH